MKKILNPIAALAILVLIAACASREEKPEFDPSTLPAQSNAAAEQDDSDLVALDEAVTGTSLNSLADTIDPVTINIKEDTSFTSNDFIAGAKIRIVEFLGKKALEVTRNYNNEIRFAFVLDKPTKLTGYSTLSFSVAGMDGSGGVYNCGLLYSDAKESGERIGSFFVSDVATDKWTSVEADLANDEVWGNNFSEDRTLYCIQFWSSQSDRIYVADLALK